MTEHATPLLAPGVRAAAPGSAACRGSPEQGWSPPRPQRWCQSQDGTIAWCGLAGGCGCVGLRPGSRLSHGLQGVTGSPGVTLGPAEGTQRGWGSV